MKKLCLKEISLIWPINHFNRSYLTYSPQRTNNWTYPWMIVIKIIFFIMILPIIPQHSATITWRIPSKIDIALHSQDQIKPFSLLHLNARSLQRNFKNLQSYLMTLEYEFTVIGVSETWLHDFICDLYNLPGYNFIENHRSHRSGILPSDCWSSVPCRR